MSGQVLVVGAGPVGMTMASELARYGVAVRIIDKAAHRSDKSKALVIWSRTLELLDRGGGAAPFIDAGYKAEAMNFIASNKVIGHVTTASVPSPYPFGLMLPQSETERLLEERLGRLGIHVEREVELRHFTQGDSGIETTIRHPGGREESSTFAWMVGCDGAHSVVRHGVGATFAGETLESDWMLADVHMTGYPRPDNEVSIYWHRDGIFVVFPISPGRYRIVADRPRSDADHPPTPTLEDVQAIIDRRGPHGLVAFDPIWLSGFRINERKVSEYRWGRAFLAGDAAHVHSPAGGQGMNTGMQDAFNLAWKLAMVVHGTGDARLLDSYSAERSAIGNAVLKATARLTAIGTLKIPIAQAVRNLAGHLMFGLAPVRRELADTMTEISIGYPESPLNGPSWKGSAGPKPGARVIPLPGAGVAGTGSRPRFTLCAGSESAAAALAERFSTVVEPEIAAPLHAGGIWLVRPDGYVACSGDTTDVIARYLEDVITPKAAAA